MIGCPDSLSNGPVVMLSFGYMLIGICVVHDYIKVTLDLFHHCLVSSIAVDQQWIVYHEASLIRTMQDCIECLIVLLVCLVFIGTRLLNLIVQSIVVSIPHSFMNIISIHSLMSWF